MAVDIRAGRRDGTVDEIIISDVNFRPSFVSSRRPTRSDTYSAKIQVVLHGRITWQNKQANF